jgi:cytochrome c-type biogenesis protein CcmE
MTAGPRPGFEGTMDETEKTSSHICGQRPLRPGIIVFFYSPSDLAEIDVPQGRTIRVGGLVEEGSVEQGEDATVAFHITDLNQVVKVNYKGILPDLFREGQGVVVVGVMEADGGFTANEVLAKHDENYMPSEVVDALKESGEWQREPAP